MKLIFNAFSLKFYAKSIVFFIGNIWNLNNRLQGLVLFLENNRILGRSLYLSRSEVLYLLLLFCRYVMSDWGPMDWSMAGFPLFHYLYVCSNSCPWSHWCYLTILSSTTSFLFVFNLSQDEGLFQWVAFSHQVAKVLELQLHQSFQWIFWVDFL